MIKKYENGLPLSVQPVIAADIIGKMAGVNFASVCKVITAIRALQVAFPNVDLAEVLDPSRLPLEVPDEGRIDATENCMDLVIHNLQKTSLGCTLADELRFRRRFQTPA